MLSSPKTPAKKKNRKNKILGGYVSRIMIQPTHNHKPPAPPCSLCATLCECSHAFSAKNPRGEKNTFTHTHTHGTTPHHHPPHHVHTHDTQTQKPASVSSVYYCNSHSSPGHSLAWRQNKIKRKGGGGGGKNKMKKKSPKKKWKKRKDTIRITIGYKRTAGGGESYDPRLRRKL